MNPENTYLWLGEITKFEHKSGAVGQAGFRCRYYLGVAYIDQRIQVAEPYKTLVMTLENDDFNTQLRLVFRDKNGETKMEVFSDTETDIPGAAFAESAIVSEIESRLAEYINRLAAVLG